MRDRHQPKADPDRFESGSRSRRGSGQKSGKIRGRERPGFRAHQLENSRKVRRRRAEGSSSRSGRRESDKRSPKVVSDMQITDGRFKGRRLKSSDSPKVRPTSRRIRESMFKVLGRRIRAGRFLDLCAGAGTVGIEAISRGALLATFVERSARMCSYIRQNLEDLQIREGHGTVFEIEIVPFLKRMSKRRRYWDVVYCDPPYDTDYEEILAYFSRGTGIKIGGMLVIEHHRDMFFPENVGVLKRWRVVTHGDTSLSFYERKS